MKKKILTLALVVVMIAVMLTSFTMAYFTDTDVATNVMTTGKVEITQNENALDENNQLVDFVDCNLYPAVAYDAEGKVRDRDSIWSNPNGGMPSVNYIGKDGATETALTASFENEVDKIVSVTNDGTVKAYVRTIFLVENAVTKDGSYLTDHIWLEWEENGGQNSGYYNMLMPGGVIGPDNGTNRPTLIDAFEDGRASYSVFVYYYDVELEPGKTTNASLKQFFLDPDATEENFNAYLGDGKLEIIALSQATQVEGFTDDRVALDTAFGEVNVKNIKSWFAK